MGDYDYHEDDSDYDDDEKEDEEDLMDEEEFDRVVVEGDGRGRRRGYMTQTTFCL